MSQHSVAPVTGSRIPKIDSPPPRTIHPGHFDRDRHYGHHRPHGIYDWLVIYTLQGHGWVRHGGGRDVVSAHDVLLIEPDVPHGYGTEGQRWELLWAHFEPAAGWRPWLQWPELSTGVHRLAIPDHDARAHIVQHLRDALRFSRTYMPHREALARNALEAALLWCDQQNPQSAFARLDPRIRAALSHISAHLNQSLSLPRVADAASMSVSRLAHLFRQQMGVSPQRFIEGQRLDRARDLLRRTNLTIKEIAAAVGFASPFYFTLRFRHATGQSPSEYRAQQGGA